MAKKKICPVCFQMETAREINDCVEARDWAREEIEARETGLRGGNIYVDFDVARPRGANGKYADNGELVD